MTESKQKAGFELSNQDPTELFEILAKLGEGSYGSVFKALDKRDGKIVAIKVLEVENEDTAELQREINILKECHSPFIVAYKGSYEKDNNIWIVMEYCGAGSLCDLMAICEKTLTEEQIAIVMKMSLFGLQYLHSMKKIHRDIKSGNILLNHEGDCKLADFGVSAELTTTMAKRKTVIGTPYWMAPEVLQSTEYNGKADIWSLAITAIELAVGEPPHANVHPMRAIFMIPTSDPPTLPDPKKWSADFNDFLKVCLVKNPEDRPTAEYLLKHHPFILKAKSKAIIAQLVDECMQEIDDYREAESKQDGEGKEGEGGEGGEGYNSEISTLDSDQPQTGTLVRGQVPEQSGGGGAVESGTMINSEEYATGTMVNQPDGGEDGEEYQGTMVQNKAQEKKAEQKKKPGEEPAYMKAARGADTKTKKKANGVQTGTMVQTKPNSPSSPQAPPGGGKPAATFMQFYRTGKNLDVNESSTLLDLRTSLVALNKAYDEEVSALQAFYNEKRKKLQALISAKEGKSS